MNIVPGHTTQLQASLLIARPGSHILKVGYTRVIIVLAREHLSQQICFDVRHLEVVRIVAAVAQIQSSNTCNPEA